MTPTPKIITKDLVGGQFRNYVTACMWTTGLILIGHDKMQLGFSYEYACDRPRYLDGDYGSDLDGPDMLLVNHDISPL